MRGLRTWVIGGLLACLAVGTATAQVDVEGVKLVKGVDRDDGTIPPLGAGELPYFYEICASGSGFDTFRVRRLAPLMLLGYFQPPECIEDRLPDQIALEQAVPSSTYEFTFLRQGVAVDSINVAWDADVPSGFADVLSPADGAADVRPDTTLHVQWSIDAAGCLPSGTVEDCADGIQLFLVDPLLDMDVSENLEIPIDAVSWPIPASVLQPHTAYDLELETVTGEVEQDASTVGGDAVLVTAIAKDINNTSFVTVPEPESAALGLIAVVALGLLSRRWGQRTRP